MNNIIHPEYEKLKTESIRGWHTWNNDSVLSHTHMPDGLTLNLILKEYSGGRILKNAFIGKADENEEQIFPGAHAYDSSYTSLIVKWLNIEFQVESATDNDDLVLLVTPLVQKKAMVLLAIQAGFMWNKEGRVVKEGDNKLVAHCDSGVVEIYSNAMPWEGVNESGLDTMTQFLRCSLSAPAVFCTGKKRSVEEVQSLMKQAKSALEQTFEEYGKDAELYEAMQSVIAWDTVYESQFNRVITPVSRLWNKVFGGYVMFCWDNYFAGYMASFGDRFIAYSNLIEITLEHTEDGFVPNFVCGCRMKTKDRSEPPVGSAMLVKVFNRFKEKWIVEYLYPMLLRWNEWYAQNRMEESGALCWGSNPKEPLTDSFWEMTGLNELFGGALESGLDNSPMYDDIPFDSDRHVMKLEDVGLTGLYIMDCQSLLVLAEILGRTEDIPVIQARLETANRGLQGLWDEKNGFFYNRRTDTGEFSYRYGATSFYALFSNNVSDEQARRMIDEHYNNPTEFMGDWMIPSISRNDPAFADQDYWRGRIWAPMNYLCYLAMKQHNLTDACHDLAKKSKLLLEREWCEKRHIHENYNAITGDGCDVGNSDKFYHWGALLSIIALIDDHLLSD